MTTPRPRLKSTRKPALAKKANSTSETSVSLQESTAMDVGLKSIYGPDGSVHLDLRSVKKPSYRWLAWLALFGGLFLVTLVIIYTLHRETILVCVTNVQAIVENLWRAIKGFYQ